MVNREEFSKMKPSNSAVYIVLSFKPIFFHYFPIKKGGGVKTAQKRGSKMYSKKRNRHLVRNFLADSF